MEPTKPNSPNPRTKRGTEEALYARKLAQRLAVGVAVLTVGVCALAIRSVANRRTYVAPTLVVTQRPRFEPRTTEPQAAPTTVAAAPPSETATGKAPPTSGVPTAPAPSVAAAGQPSTNEPSDNRLTLTSARIAVPQGAAGAVPGTPPGAATAPGVGTQPSTSARDTETSVAAELASIELDLARAEVRGDAAAATRLEQQRKDVLGRLRAAVVASQPAPTQAPAGAATQPVSSGAPQGASAPPAVGGNAQSATGGTPPAVGESAQGATGGTPQKTHGGTAMTAEH